MATGTLNPADPKSDIIDEEIHAKEHADLYLDVIDIDYKVAL